MFNLKIIIASTRPTRKGPIVAAWVHDVVSQNKNFAVELLDLAEINLPLLDESEHPRLRKYTKQHTKDWSAKIDPADAFIVVTCEYNYGFPAPLKNAIDFLSQEWADKPMAFVSYGGIAGGTRAVQMLKQVVTALKMMPIADSVNIPFFTKYISAEQKFTPDDVLQKSMNTMLDELLRWTMALKTMRNK